MRCRITAFADMDGSYAAALGTSAIWSGKSDIGTCKSHRSCFCHLRNDVTGTDI